MQEYFWMSKADIIIVWRKTKGEEEKRCTKVFQKEEQEKEEFRRISCSLGLQIFSSEFTFTSSLHLKVMYLRLKKCKQNGHRTKIAYW